MDRGRSRRPGRCGGNGERWRRTSSGSVHLSLERLQQSSISRQGNQNHPGLGPPLIIIPLADVKQEPKCSPDAGAGFSLPIIRPNVQKFAPMTCRRGLCTKTGSASLRRPSSALKDGSSLEMRGSASAFPQQRCTQGTTYRTLSGSVTAKLSRTEQAVSMLGSLVNDALLLPLSNIQHFDRKSTSRVWVLRVSSTFLGPSSADR